MQCTSGSRVQTKSLNIPINTNVIIEETKKKSVENELDDCQNKRRQNYAGLRYYIFFSFEKKNKNCFSMKKAL